MALQPINLDTLDWEQIVTAIQTRIGPDSQGKWTLQAPVDPGVTLLELFAWLLDQRIYWMKQVPPSLSLSVLALLGTSPAPAQAAVTVLQISDLAIPPRPFPVAPAGTLLQLGDLNPPVIFTLNNDVTVLPVSRMGILVNGIDHSHDLQQCRPVALLAAGQNSAQIEISLSLSAPIPAAAAGQLFSIMIELETSGDIFPQWSAEAVPGVPVPAVLTWSYTGTLAATTAFAAAQIDDGTSGLRRSGIVRLPLAADWRPEPAGLDPSQTIYKILLQIQSATFTYTPQLRRLQSNVVLAQHLWQRTKNPATSQWLALPGNVISLPDAPSDSSIVEYPPIENTVQVQIKESDGTVHPWTQVSDLSRSGPTDRVFVVNRAKSEISFGDGLTGRLPVMYSAADAADITVNYQAGGGAAGNVGEGSSWYAVPATDAAPDTQFAATNLAPGDGGAETESLLQATERSVADLNERNRAVSIVDYQNLAQTTPGVALQRAYAAVGYHPDFPCSTVPGAVTVFVVPYAPRVQNDGIWASTVYVPAPVPDQGALQAAQTRLSAAKLIGGEVFVRPPVYRKVWLTLTIAVDVPLPTGLRQTILTGLQNYLDPLDGAVDGEGWPFGDPLRPSALLGVAQAILGTAGDVQSVAVRIDSATATAQPCQDVTIQPHQLVELMHVDLNTLQRTPQSGGLR